MNYVKNAWYVGAWEHEIEDGKRGMEWSNLQEIANRAGVE